VERRIDSLIINGDAFYLRAPRKIALVANRGPPCSER
jgi:hypothetical protein